MIEKTEKGIILSLYIQPKSSRTRIIGMHGEELKIQISAPPVDGKANQALIKFFSKQLKVSKKQIHLLSGHQSRHKRILIEDCTEEQIEKIILPI